MEDMLPVIASLQTRLSDHIAENDKRFSQLDSWLSRLSSSMTEKGVTKMSDGMSDTVKIMNAPGGSDPMALMAMAMSGKGGGDGLFGGGGGGGIIGGLLLGSLLRNGNGGLFGGGNDGAAGALLRNPPEQNQANMDLMASIGQVDKAVAVSTAAMEASQAMQSANIVNQLNSVTSSLASRIDSTKETVNAMAMVLAQQLNGVDKNILENRYLVSQNITADGDRTRTLITGQYEQTLNRQLSDANAAIIELRADERSNRRARDNEINVTQTVNQAQSQQQQQTQFDRLYHVMSDALQSIRATNQAINIGAGTQTANPTNTNTNVRA